jgi:hypothetical protein
VNSVELGDLLYEVELKIIGVTEYGISMESLASGKTAPPPEGARIDVAFEGESSGPRIAGKARGVDYLHIRADGKFQLHVHAELTTSDGQKISLFADGVGTPREGEPISDLRENVTLTTSAEAYAWVNTLQVWGIGTVNLAEQVIRIKGYAAK